LVQLAYRQNGDVVLSKADWETLCRLLETAKANCERLGHAVESTGRDRYSGCMRTKRFDQTPAAHRRRPETDKYCVRCRCDIEERSTTRWIHLIDGGDGILHPEDEHLYADGGPSDLGLHPLGPSCAKAIGLAWSVVSSTPDGGPDAECTECGDMYYSGDGPSFNIAVCRDCFTDGSTGPLGVVDT